MVEYNCNKSRNFYIKHEIAVQEFVLFLKNNLQKKLFYNMKDDTYE